ncbi:unnamed protein product, partial [Rotaria sp. Silwood1]
MFRIITFVESEKSGPVVPFYNVNDHLVKMLNISERSVYRLKHELQQLRQKEIKGQPQQQQQQQQQQTEEKNEADTNVRDFPSRTISLPTSKYRESSASIPPGKILCRRHTVSSAFLSTSHIDLLIPQTLSPQKKNEKERIAICLDNTTWHNKLTEESVIPKRASTKREIQKWLKDRKDNFPEKFVKAQLLQHMCANCPPKEYISDPIAKKYAVEIFRLPKLHRSLNPIELSWNNLKQFVRDQNITFRQNDVKQLIEQLMVAMDHKRASSYVHHVRGVEEMCKRKADALMEEEIEPHIQSDSEETDSDG